MTKKQIITNLILMLLGVVFLTFITSCLSNYMGNNGVFKRVLMFFFYTWIGLGLVILGVLITMVIHWIKNKNVSGENEDEKS